MSKSQNKPGDALTARSGISDAVTSNPTSDALLRPAAIVEAYRGPIPAASELKKYEEILPGAADRILTMAEKQATHRQKLESTVVDSNVKNSKRGQCFAFIISLVVVVAGFTLIMSDKPGWGLSIIIADLAVLAAVFIGNRISISRELSHKRRDIETDNK